MNFKRNQKVLIIAEAGVNHNGSVKIAKKLIDAAVKAGADAVKFQSFKTDLLVSENAFKPMYDCLKKLELGAAEHKELMTYAKKKGMLFLSTPFDSESADLLDRLNISLFKISSGDITNLPFLAYVAEKKRPILLSTGGSTMKEIREAVNAILKTGNREISLLHCVSDYPASFEDLNLRSIDSLRKAFGFPVGFSDHSLGIEASVAAVGLGAKIIEKHFTLDRNLPGPDHKMSLEPHQLRALVASVRNIEKALGNGKKKPSRRELWCRRNARKALFSKVDIPKGVRLEEGMIAVKRPATKGIEPKFFNKLIGKKVSRDIKKDTPIEPDMVKGAL